MANNNSKTSVILISAVVLAIAAVGFGTWYKMFREVRQPGWITGDQRDNFLYGSAGIEDAAGIPYWIWLVLPRIFPEYMPGPGGYASLGLSWEETRQMPVGLEKRRIGYIRVIGNCGLCHAYSRPNGPDEAPKVFAAGQAQMSEIHRLLVFFRQCAENPRFNADNILNEAYMATELSLLDRLIYRYILIPRTRARLLHPESLLIGPDLWRHSQDPHSGTSFQHRMESLETALTGAEKDALVAYLKKLQ